MVARIDQNVVYRSLAEDPANIYSLLLVAGYLKAPKKDMDKSISFYDGGAEALDSFADKAPVELLDQLS